MTTHAAVTLRDSVLRDHLFKYRVSTMSLIARGYFPHRKRPLEAARRHLQSLISCGLLTKRTIAVRDLPRLEQPTHRWRPGQPIPSVNRLCYRLEKRFAGETRPLVVFHATRQAAIRFGGRGGRLRRTHQGTHDLLCSSVFLTIRQQHPQEASDWVNEDLYGHLQNRGDKLGDAMLIRDGRPYRLIEVLGRYTAEHISDLFRDCARRELPLDLW